VGVVVLALLIGLVYGYWYLTNDRRIRAEAQQYLHELTGAEVRVDRARFSLFGGIRLHGVRLVAPATRRRSRSFRPGRWCCAIGRWRC